MTRVPVTDLWERYRMALDDVSERLERITRCLDEAQVNYALVGGQAVALWVATIDPSAVRTTKDIDLLLDRQDLPAARAAARSAGMDYFETMGVGMFIDRGDPSPRHGVQIVWAGEKVRPHESVAAPDLADRQTLPEGRHVVSLLKLVEMKLTALREQDRVHLRDMIDVGLVDDALTQRLPAELAGRLRQLTGRCLDEAEHTVDGQDQSSSPCEHSNRRLWFLCSGKRRLPPFRPTTKRPPKGGRIPW